MLKSPPVVWDCQRGTEAEGEAGWVATGRSQEMVLYGGFFRLGVKRGQLGDVGMWGAELPGSSQCKCPEEGQAGPG